jgi:hypothetical protein
MSGNPSGSKPAFCGAVGRELLSVFGIAEQHGQLYRRNFAGAAALKKKHAALLAAKTERGSHGKQ